MYQNIKLTEPLFSSLTLFFSDLDLFRENKAVCIEGYTETVVPSYNICRSFVVILFFP